MPLDSMNDFQILQRVPEYEAHNEYMGNTFAIIDLETTGLDHTKDKITEIGIIKVEYFSHGGNVVNVHQSFNDPQMPIIDKITALTGITNEMVKGQAIDWDIVENLLDDVDFIVCHNSGFDRKFLEAANAYFINKKFACSKNDIDWQAKGILNDKLDYINWKLGYFYDAHRAINDCWATLNAIKQSGSLQELIDNLSNETYEVYAVDAPYSKKDLLKESGFYWNDGSNGKPKAWYKIVDSSIDLQSWLSDNGCDVTRVYKINAYNRYSVRV